MRFTTFITTFALSSAVFAATSSSPLLLSHLIFHQLTLPTAAQTNPEDDVASILEALREVNPEDAEAAASAMQIKLRRRDPAPVGDDLTSILAALEANNPEDAAAARQAPAKRQDDLNSILSALEANNPEDAQAARQRQVSKRQEDLESILKALEGNSPEDAKAAREGAF
jgi:hypothetical protein